MTSRTAAQQQTGRRKAAPKKRALRLNLEAVLAEAEARGVDRRTALERITDPERVDAGLRLDVCLTALEDARRGRRR